MDELFEELYRRFSRYETPEELPGCEHCLLPWEKEALLTTELRKLTESELGGYAFDVFLTVGCLNDFKYFFPRILELTVKEALYTPTEVVLRKLAMADWNCWPEEERDIILTVLDNRWKSLLQEPEFDIRLLDTWICALGQCVPDITPYLNRLLEEGQEEKLEAFVDLNLSAFMTNILGNSWWKHASENRRRILEWLTNQQKIKETLAGRYGMVW